MKIQELETSFNVLKKISNSDFLQLGRSNEDIILHWTKVEELNCYMLNVFAPINHIFFNFFNFKTARLPLDDYRNNLVKGGVSSVDMPKTEKIINSIIKSVKSNKRSVFAEIMLYGLSSFYGYKYTVKSNNPYYHSTQLLMGRYIPIIVPIDKRNTISNYYQTQFEQFGSCCVMRFAETNKIWGISHYKDLSHIDLLEGAILRMKEEEINNIIDQIEAIGYSGGKWAQKIHVQNHYITSAMGITPIRLNINNQIEKFMIIAKFRIEYAIETSTLGLLENIKDSLENKGLWPDHYNKCNSFLISMLDNELDKYPIINENPMK